MDRSLNGVDATNSFVVYDRPPRSPVRTPSRKLPFTRSRAFPSIRRRTETRHPFFLLFFWIKSIWVVALLYFLYSCWIGAQTLILSKSDLSTVQLSELPILLKNRVGKKRVLSHGIEAATSPVSKQERTKILLEVLNESKKKSPQWPTFLKLHQGRNFVGDRNPSNSTAQSCIVTAYFRTDSKHPVQQYDIWMENMLSMNDCMVIFCEKNMVDRMIHYRRLSPGQTAIVEVSLEDLPISKYYYDSPSFPSAIDFWQHQFEMDPEGVIHRGYKVFWIWLSKSWFVSTSAVFQKHLFSSTDNNINARAIDIWMWADIGSFRSKGFVNDTLMQHVHESSGLFPDTMAVLWMAHRKPNPPLNPFWNRKLSKKEKRHFYHSGSHAIAASVQAWLTFHEHFVHTMDEYAEKDLFLGEDQCVLQTTCLLFPSSCAYVPFDQVHDNKYFGLRHVLRFGPNDGKRWNLHPFQLWRPPSLNSS